MNDILHLPCGGTARLDEFSSNHSYICQDCFCVVGSMSENPRCRAAREKYQILKKLGGLDWDYNLGEEKHLTNNIKAV